MLTVGKTGLVGPSRSDAISDQNLMQKWDMQTVRELSHVDLGMNSSAVHFFVMCDAFYNVTIFAQRVCLKGGTGRNHN